MTLLNDTGVFATANIYEKDLNQVKQGQEVRVKIASLPNRTFTGKIAIIGSMVQGETRVVPMQAELNNPDGELKPGLFVELEILTNQTATNILAIPNTAIIDVNGKETVYVQNGNAYQAVEVELGQTSGDMVEIKSGLFEGDLIVTQRSPQLYAQSLRGGNKTSSDDKKEAKTEKVLPVTAVSPMSSGQVPWWLGIPVGGAIAGGAFLLGRRTQPKTNLLRDGSTNTPVYDIETYLHHPAQSVTRGGDRDREEV